MPHWYQEKTTTYVTFRLADSLPEKIVAPLLRSRDLWLERVGLDPRSPGWRLAFEALPGDLKLSYHRRHSSGLQRLLDQGHGACTLAEPGVSEALAEAMEFHDGLHYRLGDRAVAGNHGHALLTPLPGFDVGKIVTVWKRWTTRAAHQLLGTSGRLWQPETYDHLVRTPGRLRHIQAYLAAHPPLRGLGAKHAGGSPPTAG